MTSRFRIGVAVAWVSIVFSLLSFAVYFVFTAVFFVSALFGAVGALAAIASKAKRTALVAAVFGLVPLGQLLVEQFFESEYLVPLPAAAALSIAGLAFANYAQSKRLSVRAAT